MKAKVRWFENEVHRIAEVLLGGHSLHDSRGNILEHARLPVTRTVLLRRLRVRIERQCRRWTMALEAVDAAIEAERRPQ